MQHTARIYSRAAYCLLQMKEFSKAFLQLEKGKARLLSQVLTLEHIDLSHLPEEQKQALLRVRQIVHDLEAEMRLPLDIVGRRTDVELGQLLQKARTELKQIVEQISTENKSFIPNLSLPDIKQLIPRGGAIVSLLVTPLGSVIFVLPYGLEKISEEHIITTETFTESTLDFLLVGNNQDIGWLNKHLRYDGRVTNEWLTYVEAFTKQLWEIIIQPVYQKLAEFSLSEGSHVILMPQGGLGLLPLHAAWRQMDVVKCSFIDDYSISYSFSTYTLQSSLQRIEKRKILTSSLLTIVNPTDHTELPYASFETEAITNLLLPEKCVLIGDDATEENIIKEASKSTYLHFACHGFYNWEEIMHSGLQLNGGINFTLATIISKLDLSLARLVVLSACETALTEFQKSPDEYIGLPAGFLQAGTPGVIGTLWSVADLSTALIMIKFYELFLCNGKVHNVSPSKILAKAQQWLKNITAEELLIYFEEQVLLNSEQDILKNKKISKEVLENGIIRFAFLDPNSRPFENPYFWAPFIFVGA